MGVSDEVPWGSGQPVYDVGFLLSDVRDQRDQVVPVTFDS